MNLRSLTRSLVFASALCIPCLSIAKEPTSLRLWEKGAPGALGEEPKDIPMGILYRLEGAKAPTAGLIVCPGGGYGHLAMDHEGHQIAAWANQMGMTALICDYRHRTKGYGHPYPLQDAQRAIRMMRANATDWNVDPNLIGIIGFSAGGHLVSTVLTHFDDGDKASQDGIAQKSSRPDFGILCYPVIGFGQTYTHKGSQKNLIGDDASQELIKSLSNEYHVTKETPPTFLFHTQEDKAVPVENSLKFYEGLVKAGVLSELHVFPKGRHGIGLGKGIAGAEKWPELCEKWLQSNGILK